MVGTVALHWNHGETMRDTIIDCLFAVALGLCLTMLALSWFDVLTY